MNRIRILVIPGYHIAPNLEADRVSSRFSVRPHGHGVDLRTPSKRSSNSVDPELGNLVWVNWDCGLHRFVRFGSTVGTNPRRGLFLGEGQRSAAEHSGCKKADRGHGNLRAPIIALLS